MLGSRYYDPEVGRFISPDQPMVAVDAGEYNLYAYCANDPVNRSDPSGYFSIKKFFSSANLAMIGVMAIATAVSVLSCGAAAPIMAAAIVTLVAGTGTMVFAAAEMHEAITDDQNFLRDSVFQGNQKAYDTAMNITSTTAVVGTMIIAPYAGKCFVAGTAVLTENGAVAIENIQIGMLVYSAFDDSPDEITLKPVVRLFVNETYELTQVRTNDGQTITSTPGHPYYVVNKGWITAKELRAGDILLLVNGKTVIVEVVQHEILESPVKVYNFEVADFHTYFVAESVEVATHDFVLVHNACGPNGTYEKASYHNKGNSVKSPAPRNGQAALDNSVQIKPTSPRRLGYSDKQLVVLDQTSPGVYHGHVRAFNELTPKMQDIARKIFGVFK